MEAMRDESMGEVIGAPPEAEAPLHVIATSGAGTLHLRVIGELDLATAPNLASVVASLSETSTERVVIDLDGVAFMDTSGLDALLRCREECVRRGSTMHLRRISRPARRVIDLTDSGALFGL